MADFSNVEANYINQWENYFSIVPTYVYKVMRNVPQDILGLFTGNQFGKNKTTAQWIWDSILGILPVEHHNLRPADNVRTFRFASEVLPMSDDESEVKNTQYPVLRNIIPDEFIKQDITIRKPIMVIRDPQGGRDIVFEFVSYSQSTQSQAGVQRRGIWIDEHSPKSFYEEQKPRLLKASADLKKQGRMGNAWMIITLTPAQEFLDWEFDEIVEQAEVVYRTKHVRERMKVRFNEDKPQTEKFDQDSNIAVIMAATDDNPTLDEETIRKNLSFADEELEDVRRYGLFKQISGIVFKSFNRNVHVINIGKYFPLGMPHDWMHARGIDYHRENPWACGWVCLSPENEMFIYDEYYPSPERNVTLDICKNIAAKSADYKFFLNLIDPLAGENQANTGLSTLQDMNRIFYELRREGLGTGGFWQPWDTKSDFGRTQLRIRLANSLLAGRPFNNRTAKGYMPTVWVSSSCANTIEHMRNWRREQWTNRNVLLVKDPKDTLQEKFSHFNMVWEALLKSPAFSVGRYAGSVIPHDRKRRYHRAS